MRAHESSGVSRNAIIGLLDIGTCKVCCVIAQTSSPATGGVISATVSADRVLGLGHHRSRGIKAGVIVDMDEAEQAVRGAVAQAERMAGVTLDRVFVSVAAGRIKSQHFTATVAVPGGMVGEEQITRVMEGGRSYVTRDGRSVLHIGQMGFRLDGQAGLRDPRGMAGRELAAEIHAVTADEAPLRNIMLLVERCHLVPAALLPAGLASGLSTTTEDERRIGIATIDIGGGTTTLAVFADGQFIFTETLPVGGNHVTYDIARGLQTPLAEAERIKALYGTLTTAASDERDVFSYPLAGHGSDDGELEQHQASRAQVRRIIEPRMDVIFRLVRERLEAAGGGTGLTRGRVALTGGASQLVGLPEFAANRFGVPVKVGRPAAWGGVPASVCTPAYATVLGLLVAADQNPGRGASSGHDQFSPGYFGRVGRWLKESF